MLFKKATFFCLFLLCLPLLVLAQKPAIHFTSLRMKDGLSSNTVHAVLKDRYGLMWIATEDGLNKFDGTNFTVYRHKQGDSTSLPANEIYTLHEDKSGNLWVGGYESSISRYDRKKDVFITFPSNAIGRNLTRSIFRDYRGKIWTAHFRGLNILDPQTNHIYTVPVDTTRKGALTTNRIICVFEDSKQRMWVGTDDGLFLFNRTTNSFTHFQHSDRDPSSLGNNLVKAIAEDKQGNLWIGTADGLSQLKPDGKGFTTYCRSSPTKPSGSSFIFSIAADIQNQLWLGTEAGLTIFDPKTGEASSFVPDNRNEYGLTSKSVRCIYIDKEGLYWLGTFRGGINKYDKYLNLFRFKQTNAFAQKGLNASAVTSFAEYKAGNIFVGTDGGGLSLFNRRTESFQHYPIHPEGRNASEGLAILALEKSRQGPLYVGTYGNGLFILDPGSGTYRQVKKGTGPGDLNSNDIFCIREDRKGNVWIGTNGGGINVMGPQYKIILKYLPRPKAANEARSPINEYIRDIEEDRKGNIWIASKGSGIAVLNSASGKFTVYNQSNSNLTNDAVHCILEDSRGAIWVGCSTGGINLFDPKTNRFVTFSEKEGLQGTMVYEILEDKNGQIWITTNRGISRFDVRTKKFTAYTYHNGVQNSSFVGGAGLTASDGELFFGGLEGFNYFDPAQLRGNKKVSPILLTDLRVSNKSVTPAAKGPLGEHISIAREIHLNYKENFALSFVALDFTIPEQYQYSYLLEGFERDWNYVGTSKTASYTNLDPGEYVFHVRASNKEGVWDKASTTIKIYVHPPFWRTKAAYLIYVLVLASLILYLRHKSTQRLRRKFALEQEHKEVERIRELDRLKIKFLTNLSHEFRTPISLILGPVDQLLAGEKAEKATGQLQMVKRNARRLLNLVNQLLDFRKMEEHELKLHLAEGEFVSFVKDVSDSFKDLSDRRKIDFEFKSGIDCLFTVFDSDKIERILFNLLSNAFKFTLAGGKISLELELAEKAADSSKAWVSLKVRDTGIGIPVDKKEKIFERFFQNNSSAAILNQGTGIGLSITREFVQMHGGTIHVDSEPGKGTIFTVHLPLRPVTNPATNSHEPAAQTLKELESFTPSLETLEPEVEIESDDATAPPTVKGQKDVLTILLVEDNEDFRFYLKDNLRENYKVVEAANGKEGWQKTLAHHPQLVVSDVNMPFMDGIELCRKLKGDKRTAHIPVILLTAFTSEGDQVKGLETGANDYITKPFNFEILNARVKNLLHLNSTLKNTYTKQIKVQTAEVEMESEDAKLLNKITLYLEENLTNSQLSVEDLSKQVGMSRSALYHKVLEVTGMTPVEYIRSFKLEKAAVLLEKSDLNIAQVAYSTGFATPHYFSKSFKAKFNMLPSEYITKMKKEVEKKNEDKSFVGRKRR